MKGGVVCLFVCRLACYAGLCKYSHCARNLLRPSLAALTNYSPCRSTKPNPTISRPSVAKAMNLLKPVPVNATKPPTPLCRPTPCPTVFTGKTTNASSPLPPRPFQLLGQRVKTRYGDNLLNLQGVCPKNRDCGPKRVNNNPARRVLQQQGASIGGSLFFG